MAKAPPSVNLFMMKVFWRQLKDTFTDFIDDKAPRLSAALAYYTIFSLAPMLIIVISVAGLIWDKAGVQEAVVSQFAGLLGRDGAALIQTMIENASQPAKSGWVLAAGVATLLFGATGTFVQLKDALNTVWEVKVKPMKGWLGIWRIIRTYLLSFTMVLVMAFLLLLTLVVSAALAAIGGWIGTAWPLPPWLMHIIDVIVSLGVITLLFAVIFKVLPDTTVAWRDVWIGAVITALLFTAGKFALGMYLGRTAVASVFGAAGSVVLILLWTYYASVIFLLGAEYTQVFARKSGSRIGMAD